MSEAFPCNSCGACCKSIRLSTQTEWLDRGDGVCRYFDDQQNTCTIYENRPEICNVRVMYEKHYQSQFNWSEFVLVNQKACDALLVQIKK
ncbi:MAG: YkgJ family cysteine cluster protein [Methylococcales bacterium]|nr:YkgJ family cysteine cluster protein [Methylococcales bacterium]